MPRPCPVPPSNTTTLWCLFPITGYELRMASPTGDILGTPMQWLLKLGIKDRALVVARQRWGTPNHSKAPSNVHAESGHLLVTPLEKQTDKMACFPDGLALKLLTHLLNDM